MGHGEASEAGDSRPPLQLATVVVAVVTEMEEVPTAVVTIPVAVEVPEVAVVIAFVGLRSTLHSRECQQTETGRAGEREKLCTHLKLLSGRGEGGECPTH